MLVLNRKQGDDIYLHTSDGIICIRLISVRSNRADIGIEAPRSILVERDGTGETHRKFKDQADLRGLQ